MSGATIGYIGIVVMLALLFLRMPIYLCMGVTGFLGLIWIRGLDGALTSLGTIPYMWCSYWIYIAIPLFILMGQFAVHSGISQSLYDSGHKFIGHLSGGLGIATVGACGAFAATSGSSLANAATMGLVAIPQMERHGYDRPMAAGCVAAGGTLGVMIPPSTGLIIVGAITGQSIGRLFIAVIFPGLLMMLTFMATVYVLVKINPKLAPPIHPFSWKERFASLIGVWPVMALRQVWVHNP